MIRFAIKTVGLSREIEGETRTFFETMPVEHAKYICGWNTYIERGIPGAPLRKIVAVHPVTHPFTVRVAHEHVEAAREALDQQGLVHGRDYIAASNRDEHVFWFMTVAEATPIKMFYAKAM